MWTEAIGGAGIAATIINGYLLYRGSDRASERSQEIAEAANSTTGFVALTQEQRKELDDLRARVRESEESALNAQRSADQSAQRAQQVQTVLERCQLQQERLTIGYSDLWEWALKCELHREDPPPRPPVGVIFTQISRREEEQPPPDYQTGE